MYNPNQIYTFEGDILSFFHFLHHSHLLSEETCEKGLHMTHKGKEDVEMVDTATLEGNDNNEDSGGNDEGE
jgi:CMP-2-keto-3-deoxyoctulosonic acid synthetase